MPQGQQSFTAAALEAYFTGWLSKASPIKQGRVDLALTDAKLFFHPGASQASEAWGGFFRVSIPAVQAADMLETVTKSAGLETMEKGLVACVVQEALVDRDGLVSFTALKKIADQLRGVGISSSKDLEILLSAQQKGNTLSSGKDGVLLFVRSEPLRRARRET
jgi:hypothetical protein